MINLTKIEPLISGMFPTNTKWGISSVESAGGELSKGERLYLDSASSDQRRKEFTAGRVAAHLALQKLGAKTEVLRHGNGAPIWPQNIVGSICHKDAIALALVAWQKDYSGIGIDLEPVLNDLVISKKIALPSELSWIDRQDSELRLTKLYAAKEALYKCINPISNTFFGFKDAELTPIKDGFEAKILIEFLNYQPPPSISIKVSVIENYVIAWVALKN